MAVTRVNISIPLRTTNENGFFIHRETPQRQLLGYVVQMRVQQAYAYLELQGVPSELAADLLNRVRAIVPWAALRLDFGIRAAGGDLRGADGAGFDGQFATAYPAHLTPSPLKIESNHRTAQGARLFPEEECQPPPTSPPMIGPNSCHFSPLKRIICSCSIG
jgi:hypothetical protein